MLLDYVSRMVFSLGAIRALFLGLIGMALLRRFAAKGKGGTFLQYYWYFVHLLSNYAMLDLLFAHYGVVDTGTFVSYATFAVLVYVLMFAVPANEFRKGFSFMQLNEAVEGKVNDVTKRLVLQAAWRSFSSVVGIVAFLLLLVISLFMRVPYRFFTMLCDWMVSISPWLLWSGAAVAGIACVYSAYNGIVLLVNFLRYYTTRKAMEDKEGRKISRDEYMRRIFEQRKKDDPSAQNGRFQSKTSGFTSESKGNH